MDWSKRTKWYEKLINLQLTQGYKQSKSDHSLFTYEKGEDFTVLIFYVDDVILAENSLKEFGRIKGILDSTFKIKDLGPLKYFLGLEVSQAKFGITICKRKYCLDLLSLLIHESISIKRQFPTTRLLVTKRQLSVISSWIWDIKKHSSTTKLLKRSMWQVPIESRGEVECQRVGINQTWLNQGTKCLHNFRRQSLSRSYSHFHGFNLLPSLISTNILQYLLGVKVLGWNLYACCIVSIYNLFYSFHLQHV